MAPIPLGQAPVQVVAYPNNNTNANTNNNTNTNSRLWPTPITIPIPIPGCGLPTSTGLRPCPHGRGETFDDWKQGGIVHNDLILFIFSSNPLRLQAHLRPMRRLLPERTSSSIQRIQRLNIFWHTFGFYQSALSSSLKYKQDIKPWLLNILFCKHGKNKTIKDGAKHRGSRSSHSDWIKALSGGLDGWDGFGTLCMRVY